MVMIYDLLGLSKTSAKREKCLGLLRIRNARLVAHMQNFERVATDCDIHVEA